jgi:hypothetical protein
MTFRALAMLGLVLLSGAAAGAVPGGPPFSFWVDYGASAVSHESESLTVDDLTLGSEYDPAARRQRPRRGVVSELSSPLSIMTVVAWALYRDAWVGIANDVVGVAAVAFLTDFTLDAVVDAVSKLKKLA